MVIYKYPLLIEGFQEIEVPEGTVPISVCNQYEHIVLYCIRPDIDNAKTKYLPVRIVGTGHLMDFPGNYKFIGTVPMANGKLMWHVFAGELSKEML